MEDIIKESTTNQTVPTEQDAKTILHVTLGKDTQSIHRFPAGVINYVYGVNTTDGANLVVRLTTADKQGFFEGAIHWYKVLQEKGVPLPVLHFAESDPEKYGFPVMIMDHVKGKDLGDVYQELHAEQKRSLAKRIAAMQKAVATLPMGKGFGYAASENDPSLKKNWIEVLDASLERSRDRIHQVGVVPVDVVERVKSAIHAHDTYFSQVKAQCFLDDTTTKNVIIENGELTGIIDVDTVAYGDPLFPVALTRMSLLAKEYDTDYITYWLEELHVTDEQRKALDLYTALFCVDFLAEQGQRFNKQQTEEVDQTKINQLLKILDTLL